MRTCVVALICLLGSLFGLAHPLAAQSASTNLPSTTLQAHAVEENSTIHLDGQLDEASWEKVPARTEFTQQEPVEGGAPSERTSIRILHDDHALYIGVRLHYSDPSNIRANQLRRDASLGSDDRLMWTLDPYNDGRNAYFFETNPIGLRGDGLMSIGQGSNLNKSWDGIWNVETARHSDGWSAEIRIPFRTLQFEPTQSTWGFNMQRTIRIKNEEVLWAGHERDQGIFRPQFAGELQHVRGPSSTGLGVDITPFGLSTADRSWAPGGESTTTTIDAGGDLSYAFTPGLRAALTVNTDFAEVEVDQRRVNLTRFPLRFPEKRDFFLEGSNVFEFAPRSSQYPFFSRRIGLVEGSPIPILAGGRMNGRMGPYNVGFFQVRTREADVPATNTSRPSEDFTVARVVRNVGAESQVGLIYTRRATQTASSAFDCYTNCHTLGADLELSTSTFLGNQNLQFQAFFVGHTAPATADTMSWGHRTTRGLRLNYPNQPWSAHVSYREFGAAYDPAVGFVGRRSFRRLQPSVSYEPVLEDHPTIRQLSFGLRFEYLTDLALDPQTVEVRLSPLELRFNSGDQVETDIEYAYERLVRPFDILGDASILLLPDTYPTWSGQIEGRTADHRFLSGDAELEYGGFWSGTRTRTELGATIRPLPGLNMGLDWEHSRVNLQEGAFRTHLLRFDGNVDLTPDLSLTSQLQYDNLTERLGLFARLRWILQPGSDLYLVYTHNWRRLDGRLSPRNVETAAKLTYTIRL